MAWPPDIAVLTRRRRREGAKAGSPYPAGVSTLLTALGDPGDGSVVLAMYDFRKNVTAAAGAASAVADVRGSVGFGPTASAGGTGTANPTYDGVGQITWAPSAASKALFTPTSALFDLSVAKCIWWVGTVPTGSAASNYFCTINNSAFTASLSGRVTASDTHIDAFVNAAIAGTVATSTTIRLVLVYKNATTSGSVRVPTSAASTVTTTNSAAGNQALGFGGTATGSPWSGTGSLVGLACGVLVRSPTAGDVTALQTYATTLGATLT